MTIAAGRLRHRIRIEELIPLLDTSGNVIQDENTGEVTRAWVEVATQWAAIEPLSTREFIQSQATQSLVTARIIMRKPDRIDAAMRLRHVVQGVASTVYNIHGVLTDKDSGLEYVTIPVSAGVSESGQ